MDLLLLLSLGALIGLVLGWLGGGGAILTVPALVYVVGQGTTAATTSSLVIVGATAAGRWTLVAAMDPERQKAAAARAAETLAGVDGVEEAAALDRKAAEDLLRPWLGDAVLPDLPLPFLVAVRLNPEAPASALTLSRALAEAGLDADGTEIAFCTARAGHQTASAGLCRSHNKGWSRGRHPSP